MFPRDDVLSSWTIHVRCTRDLDTNQGVVWIDYSLAWTTCRRASLAENGLSLGIQSLPLRGLSTDCAEALDAQRLARLFVCITPLLQCASGPVLLRSRGRAMTLTFFTFFMAFFIAAAFIAFMPFIAGLRAAFIARAIVNKHNDLWSTSSQKTAA